MRTSNHIVTCALGILAAFLLVPSTPTKAAQEKGPLDIKIEEKLTNEDPKDKVRTNSVHKVHTVKLQGGRTYVIDLMSTEFDAYLRVEDSTGKQLASDDDSGVKLNARISFDVPKDDTYRIIATTFAGGTGSYVLAVREQAGGPAIDLPLKDGTAQVDGQMTKDDPKDTIRKGSNCKNYNVKLQAGKIYQIDMVSKEFDTYLRIEDASGKELARDDDSGGNLNARIVFKCTSDGTYRIVATSFLGGMGNYTLTVKQQ